MKSKSVHGVFYPVELWVKIYAKQYSTRCTTFQISHYIIYIYIYIYTHTDTHTKQAALLLEIKERESTDNDQTISMFPRKRSAVARKREKELKIFWTKERNRKEDGRR